MQQTVGREDRLVRGGVALSLTIMSGFGAASAGIGFTVLLFAAVAAYFAVTAITGWDPVYVRAGIDTRPADHEGREPGVDHGTATEPSVEIDLRDSAVDDGRQARAGSA